MRPTVPSTPGNLIWRLSMRWRATTDAALAPLGLTHAGYAVLASLFGLAKSGVTPSQRELADHTGLDPIYISKLVRRLETDALIRRTEDPNDSRAVKLELTQHGTSVIEPAIKIVLDLQEQLTAPLGGIESDQTQNLIEDLELLLAYVASLDEKHDKKGNDK